MPAYSFEAVDPQGQPRKGVIEADTARAARSQLRAQSLVPLSVEPVKGSQADADGVHRRGLFGKRVFSSTTLAIWTRQLAGLVSSGLPLERALTAMADEADSESQHHLVASLRAEVNAGASFARALAQHPGEFSDIFTAVIGAGLYPAIVTCVAVVIVLFLVGYVVPQVANVFAGTKRALPLLTQIMLGVSELVRHWGWLIGLMLVLLGGLARYLLTIEAWRLRFDAAWLGLPLVGKLSRGYNAARFASTLAMLAAAGVPILRALQAAAETVSNRAMRADALDALVLVREGAPLGSALAQKKRFPGLVAMFARLGEQTGQLPVMLQRAAVQLSTEVQRRATQLATILEPLLIVGMGLMVMLIVLAVLMPIIQLNQFVK